MSRRITSALGGVTIIMVVDVASKTAHVFTDRSPPSAVLRRFPGPSSGQLLQPLGNRRQFVQMPRLDLLQRREQLLRL